jgi:hypothetical protein
LIRGFFDPADPWPQPKLTVTLQLHGLPQVGSPDPFSTEFLIDTGAAISTLNPFVARNLSRISGALLMQPDLWLRRDHFGIGGSAEFYCVECVYVLSEADGHTRTVRGELDIARPQTGSAFLPSVLGWDVLQHFAMHLDSSRRLVELT